MELMTAFRQAAASATRAAGIYRIALFVLAVLLATPSGASPGTALREYLETPDPVYQYTHVASVPQPGLTVHLLSLTSQSWRAAGEIDRAVWTHWLAVMVPATVTSTTAAMFVAGGDNTASPPRLAGTEFQVAAQLALAAGTVVAVVTNVPNQPLTPADALMPLSEDALVAYSWDKAMDTGDWRWPVYLPMAKSVVRAMDATQAFAPAVAGKALERFVVLGFSKRAAATWLTAAVDPRVAAIAPGVFDVLNMAPQFEHHYRAYGFYADAVRDYTHYGVLRRIRSPEGRALLQVIDPYSYRATLSLPKYLINSPGDQFFLPDSGRHYLDLLSGETLTRYVPNTDHGLASSAGGVTNALTGLLAWYQHVVHGAPRPTVIASVVDGVLTARTSPPAAAAYLWTATNPAARDFRKEAIGEAWVGTPVSGSGNGTYTVMPTRPPAGYTAFFLEFVYPGIAGVPQTYSTPVYVTPDTEPFAVTDPIVDPRGKGYWRQRLRAAITGHGATTEVAGFFPLPLFDRYLADVAAAAEIFESGSAGPNGARQHCLATRLNIASQALGWYSPLRRGADAPRPLWQAYLEAHDAYLEGDPEQAERICRAINRADGLK